MNNDKIYDLTTIMEQFVGEDLQEIDIMAELLTIAEAANFNNGYDLFRIGDGIYTLDKLRTIQELEKKDVL